MKKPKYEKDQVVYGRSDWFSGSFIPEIYTIRDVKVEDEHVLYKVKGRNVYFEEEMFSPTEEEAQIAEVERFRIVKKNEIDNLKELLEKHNLLQNGQLAIENLGTSSHRFNVGQIVYGHMDGNVEGYEPETFQIVAKGKQKIEGVVCNVYKMKRHGNRLAYEDTLFATYEEALLAEIKRLGEKTKGQVNSITSRSRSLGIENQVELKVLTLRDNFNAIELKEVN